MAPNHLKPLYWEGSSVVTLASARQACCVPMSCMGPRITDQGSSPLTYHPLPTQGKPMRQVSSSTWASQNAGTKGEESKPTWALLVALSWQVTHTVVSGLHHAPSLCYFSLQSQEMPGGHSFLFPTRPPGRAMGGLQVEGLQAQSQGHFSFGLQSSWTQNRPNRNACLC